MDKQQAIEAVKAADIKNDDVWWDNIEKQISNPYARGYITGHVSNLDVSFGYDTEDFREKVLEILGYDIWEAGNAQQSPTDAVAFGDYLKKFTSIEDGRGKPILWWDRVIGGEKYTTAELYKLFNPSGAAAQDNLEPFVSDSDILGFIKNELLPCPLCGNSATYTHGKKNKISGNIVYTAGCSNTPECSLHLSVCLGKEDTAKEARNEAIERWNKRAAPQAAGPVWVKASKELLPLPNIEILVRYNRKRDRELGEHDLILHLLEKGWEDVEWLDESGPQAFTREQVVDMVSRDLAKEYTYDAIAEMLQAAKLTWGNEWVKIIYGNGKTDSWEIKLNHYLQLKYFK